MSLGLDYADSLEYAYEEIRCIEKDLIFLKENKCDCLIQALEVITLNNENIDFL